MSTANQPGFWPKKIYIYIYIYFPRHHMSSQTSWSPPTPRLWLKCNRLLKLGRPVGAVALSRWEWWWNERWIWGNRGALNLISTNYPDHGHHGRLHLSRKRAYCRAGNRTRDLMVSSQELWPPSHEAGLFRPNIKMYKIIIIAELSYGREIRFFALRVRYRPRLTVFEKKKC